MLSKLSQLSEYFHLTETYGLSCKYEVFEIAYIFENYKNKNQIATKKINNFIKLLTYHKSNRTNGKTWDY